MDYVPLIEALEQACELAKQSGNADLIAMTQMTLDDAHYFITREITVAAMTG